MMSENSISDKNEYFAVDKNGNPIKLSDEAVFQMKLDFVKAHLGKDSDILTCVICKKEFVGIYQEYLPVCSSIECNYEWLKRYGSK